MTEGRFIYTVEIQGGNYAIEQGERFADIVKIINAAVNGNAKIMLEITRNEKFKDMLFAIKLLQAIGGNIKILSRVNFAK